ncbi:hypothetical protein ACIA5G_14810 [Amycolatopsis sp. NPDC051758]|uniref:hypothetical protein n=1 Tax=Amycolatopsis sp. NPDC051758 TaxID=3363935 RepID=UPI0037AE4249
MPHDDETARLATYQLVTVPSYRLITLRDQDCDAAPDSDGTIDDARRAVAASSGYELFIDCAQDLLSVTVTVHVRTDSPEVSRADRSPVLELECPSGELALGSPTGDAIGIEVEPGTYSLIVEYEGRQAAAERRQEILDERARSGTDLHTAANASAGPEQYLLSMWRTGPVSDDD